MTIGYGLRGGIYSGHIKSVLDLTSKYSGTVYGFSNGFGSIAGFLAPLVTGAITDSDPSDPAKWRIVSRFNSEYLSKWLFFLKGDTINFGAV